MNSQDNWPTVTQVLSPYVDFSMVPEYVLTRKTEIGRTVHQTCAAIAQNLWIPQSPFECVGYIKSFRRFFDKYVVEVVFVEKRFYHPVYQYSGQIDFYGKLINIGFVVLDWKTPITEQKTWCGQMAGYDELVMVNKNHIDKTGALQLDADGGIPKMIWYKQDPNDLNAFLGALTAYNHFK